MKCGGCGYKGKAGKNWRVKGGWVRCPRCVRAWKDTMEAHRQLDEDATAAAEGRP